MMNLAFHFEGNACTYIKRARETGEDQIQCLSSICWEFSAGSQKMWLEGFEKEKGKGR